MSANTTFASKHFTIHALAEGIYAAIATNGGHAICNAGLVDLGDRLLVFDTFLSPQAALDLHRFATEKFNHPPQLVVNSHYHNDHIWGNQVFANDGQIISSVRTRELIATAGMEEFAWYAANSAQQLASLRAQYQATDDEQQKQELLLWMGEYEGVVQASPDLKVCLPGITFEGTLEIHGTQRSCQLASYVDGHTGSDTVLHLPQDRVIFMSDLLFVSCNPYLGDGDPFKLVTTLRALGQLEATYYVPGHGPVGTAADVYLLIEYIEGCIDTAQRLVKTGDTSEDRIKELKLPEKYQGWLVPKFYQSNIRFLCQRLSPQAAVSPAS